MKILIAPDSFKESLTAPEVAANIERGILRALPGAEIIKVPMADGGEGTVTSLVEANEGELIKKEVTGPLGEPVEASYGILPEDKTAVIEMAAASGLELIPSGRADPAITTTYGTGELIKEALDKGVDKIIIGIGGSATNDAGVGMAQALGIKFSDKNGEEIGFGGGELNNITAIDVSGLDAGIEEVAIKVACDVNNPLYGPRGAAYIYGPQKGADRELVEELDKNLRHFAAIVKRELGLDVQDIPGAGAAGGLGAGLAVFLGAELKPGIEIVINANRLEEKMTGVDLVITGEGKLDSQTVNGKTPVGVARVAKKFNIPVIALAGIVASEAKPVIEEGIDAYFSIIQKPVSLEEAVKMSPEWLQLAGEQVGRLIKVVYNK